MTSVANPPVRVLLVLVVQMGSKSWKGLAEARTQLNQQNRSLGEANVVPGRSCLRAF